MLLGCSGFDIHTGMSTAVLHEVSINEMMINQCKGEIFLLADSTKIGTIHQFIIADASAFQYVITDNRVNKDILEEFHEYGLNAVGLPPFYNYDEKINLKSLINNPNLGNTIDNFYSEP